MPRLAAALVVLFASGVASGEPPTILVLGDSLSAGYGIQVEEGWVQLLRERLALEGSPHRVVNASISGDTTRGGRSRLPAALEAHDPQIVVIELGGNDGLRGLPLEETRSNLVAMVDEARAHGAEVLLVGIRLPPNYGSRYTEQFYANYVDVAEESGVALVPFLLEGVALEPELMQADGIHPRAKAQPLILDVVWPHLEPLL